MLDLRDPQVTTVLRWFSLCYAVETTPTGRPMWVRKALPADGGIGSQSAWLMDALEFTALVQQQALDDYMKRDSKRQTTP